MESHKIHVPNHQPASFVPYKPVILVNGKDDIPYIMGNKNVWNHQPDYMKSQWLRVKSFDPTHSSPWHIRNLPSWNQVHQARM